MQQPPPRPPPTRLCRPVQAALLAARAQVKMAQSRIEQANAEVRNAQATPNTVAATKAKAESADAQALRSKSALDQAQLNLSYTTITAPVDGVVGKRSVQVGSNVAIGQDLMAVVPLRDVWVTANFKETQLAHMRPGQPVKINVDTYGGRKWDGHVTNIGGATGAKYSLLAAGECDRQLREGRAAHSGANRLRRQRQAGLQQGRLATSRHVGRT